MPRFARRRGWAGSGDDAATSPHVARRDGPWIEVDRGVRLHTDDPVPDPERPVVVVPCCGNGTELDRLAESGLQLLRYDVRSRGASDPVAGIDRVGFWSEVVDLGVTLDIHQIARASVVAWSYHAGTAVRFALEHPQRIDRLVLVAAIPVVTERDGRAGRSPSPAQLARLDQLQADDLPTKDPAAWCRAWREVYVPLRMGRPEAFDRLAAVCHLPNEHPAHVTRTVIAALSEVMPYDWRKELRSLAVPVLVVHGTADPDPLEQAEAWVDAVPDGRMLPVEGAGTIPWVEEPDRFFPTVNRFLRGERV